METTPGRDDNGRGSVERRKSSSASKLVASGDRGATGKARLEFRKGFYNKDTKESWGSTSKTSSSRLTEQEQEGSTPRVQVPVLGTPKESSRRKDAEAKSPPAVTRNLGTEFLSVERTSEPQSATVEKASSFKLITIVILVIGIFFAFTYYPPTSPLPFCDSDSAEGIFSSASSKHWYTYTNLVTDNCRPCPSHAICRAGEMTCDQGFIEFGGRCVEDKKFNVVAKEIRRKLETILRNRAGLVLCGMRNVQEEMSSSQLYEAVMQSFGNKLPLDEARFIVAFTEALNSFVNASVSFDEFECIEKEDNLWCRALRPSLPVSCRLRFFLLRRWSELLIAFLLFAGFTRLYFWLRRRRWIDRQVEKATKEVYRLLTGGSQLKSPMGEKQKLVVTRLRDDLLHDESVLKWKDVIWRKVVERVNGDSRILKSRQIVNDLPQLVWEWHDKVIS